MCLIRRLRLARLTTHITAIVCTTSDGGALYDRDTGEDLDLVETFSNGFVTFFDHYPNGRYEL